MAQTQQTSEPAGQQAGTKRGLAIDSRPAAILIGKFGSGQANLGYAMPPPSCSLAQLAWMFVPRPDACAVWPITHSSLGHSG